MNVGVLSDTHLRDPIQASRLAEKLLSGPFSDVAAILHAGDAVIPCLEEVFAPLPWYSVRGNMDHALPWLPISRVVELNGKKIGLIHGWGAPSGLEQRVMEHFSDRKLDVLVFGHSHMPFCRRVGEMLLFNPGSATDRRSAPGHTVGLLYIGAEVEGEIISID